MSELRTEVQSHASIALHRAVTRCSRPRQGRVILVHGLGEHSGRYYPLAGLWANMGLETWAFDLRGHGRSPGRRGAVPYQTLVEDLTEQIRRASAEETAPLALFGHSLGGGLVAHWLTQHRHHVIRCAVLSAPWLELTQPPASWLIPLYRCAVLCLGRWRVRGVPPVEQLTSNPAAIAEFRQDRLLHRWISLELAVGAYDAGRRALANAEKCLVPVLGLHSPDDAVTSSAATRQFCERAPAGEYWEWPGLKHELHHEVGWEERYRLVGEWLIRQLSGSDKLGG